MKFEINNKEYEAVEFGFNTNAELQEMGIDISENLENKNLSFIRAYIAICMGRSAKYAGEEIEKHVINGGTLDEVSKIIVDKMENSDFIKALIERAKKQMETEKKATTKVAKK